MAEIIFFGLGLLVLVPKVGGGTPKKKGFWPCLELLAQSLETQSVTKAKKSYFQPPTFDAKNRRPRPKTN
jgi:hypothetical protein